MSIEAKIVAFEGGKLRSLTSAYDGHEAVLALPLSRLLIKMVRVPAETDPVEFSKPLLKALSPFPDDDLTVSCELVREEENGEKIVIAAALPESAADDIGEALDAEKINVLRIDALVFGQLRGVWKLLGQKIGRRLVAFRSADCLSLVVLDGDQPSAIRALTDTTELRREVMLSLLEAEDFGGARTVEEVVLVEAEREGEGQGEDENLDPELSFFGPIRRIPVGSDAALVGVGERSEDAGALNALPESWREVLEETRFKAKLVKYLSIAGGIWLLVMGVLFGVPLTYGFLTDRQVAETKRQHKKYQEVERMQEKVKLVHKYSDHNNGALETLKAISDRLPEGMTLASWEYRRDEAVRVSGDADDASSVYEFRDRMETMSFGEGEDAERVFKKVDMGALNASKGKQRFNIELSYGEEEEE